MKKLSILGVSAVAVGLAFAMCGWADDTNSNAYRNRSVNSQGSSASRSSQGSSASRSQNRSRNADSGSNANEYHANSTSSRSQSMTSDEKRYFDAGYLQGYHAGYWDSQDDYVMLLFETQNAKKQRRNQQQGNQQTTAQSNLRRQLRGQMRLAARGNQGSHTSQYFSGEILKTKRAPLRNTGQDHYIVLLETQQGKRRIVDLGPTSKYGRNDIHQGQQVSVQGRMAHTRDDVPVLLARNVRVAGENITINRSSRQSSHQQQTSQ